MGVTLQNPGGEPEDARERRRRIVRWQSEPEAIESVIASREEGGYFDLPFAPLGRVYYRATHGDVLEEYTFAIENNGDVVSIVECDNASNMIGRFGFPIEVWFKPGLPYEMRRQAVIDVASELRRLANEHSLDTVRVRSAVSVDPDGLVLNTLLERGAQPTLELRGVIDLSISEGHLFDDLRKGHRQQVRWGNANLTWSFVDRANPSRSDFEAYRAFHCEVAGRVTRGPESWAAMYHAIATGQGDLILGHLEGNLVSGTLILDGGNSACYASGVYQRQLSDKPLGHAALFSAILRAKARGRSTFDVGELPLTGSAASEKEVAIGYFKRGFTSRTAVSIVLAWRSGQAQGVQHPVLEHANKHRDN